MNQQIKNLVIADKDEIFIDALTTLLSTNPDYQILEVCLSEKSLINCSHLHKADLVFIGVHMLPQNGISIAKQINFMYPTLPMIALIQNIEINSLVGLIESGFKGLIYKPNIQSNLFLVMNEVLNNRLSFADTIQL